MNEYMNEYIMLSHKITNWMRKLDNCSSYGFCYFHIYIIILYRLLKWWWTTTSNSHISHSSSLQCSISISPSSSSFTSLFPWSSPLGNTSVNLYQSIKLYLKRVTLNSLKTNELVALNKHCYCYNKVCHLSTVWQVIALILDFIMNYILFAMTSGC